MPRIEHDEYHDPHFRFTSEKGEIDATPDCTTIYLHQPKDAGVDHVYVRIGETDTNSTGLFLWRPEANRYFGDGSFDEIVHEMQEEGYDLILCDEPAEWDQRNFDRYIEQRIPKLNNRMIAEALEAWNGEA